MFYTFPTGMKYVEVTLIHKKDDKIYYDFL